MASAEAALERNGLVAALHTRKDDFESAPLRWVQGMLRLANARGEREQVRRVSKAFYELEGVDVRVERVVASAAASGGDLLRAWLDETLALGNLSSGAHDVLSKGARRLQTAMDHRVFAAEAFQWTDGLAAASEAPGQEVFAEYSPERDLWRQLERSAIARLGSDGLTLEAFLQEVDLSPKTPPPPKGAVRLMTIHAAKGMEFEHVYLIGLAEEVLPSYQALKKGDGSRELEEERRNCFVAITRAVSSLTLTYASQYFGWSKVPSRFLKEMGLLTA